MPEEGGDVGEVAFVGLGVGEDPLLLVLLVYRCRVEARRNVAGVGARIVPDLFY